MLHAAEAIEKQQESVKLRSMRGGRGFTILEVHMDLAKGVIEFDLRVTLQHLQLHLSNSTLRC
eukprot:2400982-Amphidinium_carterae.3